MTILRLAEALILRAFTNNLTKGIRRGIERTKTVHNVRHRKKTPARGSVRRRPATKKIGYLRVSTSDQKPDRQIDGLKMICDELHIERRSAVGSKRPVYEKIMHRLKSGDVFVIWDLDRAFRSAKQALNELDRLRENGIHIMIVSLRIDTTTPHGRFIYTITSACAEYERDFLSKRTREGLASARARGKRLGRPPKLTIPQLKRAAKRLAAHETYADIARDYGVAAWTLSRSLARYDAMLRSPSR